MRIKEIIAAEKLTERRCEAAAKHLDGFFVPNSSVFLISAEDGEPVPEALEPNAATSHIGAVISCLPTGSASRRCPTQSALRKHVEEARDRYLDAKRPWQDALPLGSFGVLPPFATAFLVEFLSPDKRALKHAAFSVAVRRLLWIADGLKGESAHSDPLHPYLLYRIARALLALRETMAEEATPAFVQLLASKDFVDQLGDKAAIAAAETGANDPQFMAELVARYSSDTLKTMLNNIERVASIAAHSSLMWQRSDRKDRADPSALLLAIATLSLVDERRHDTLIAEGLRASLRAFSGATLPARRPFKVDEKGRALFVTSLECASVLMDLALKRFSGMGAGELNEVLRASGELEGHVEDQVQRITARGQQEREGWCSDRAYKVSRIDSWVTVEGFAFLRRRLEFLNCAKRRKLLRRYNGKPAADCAPPWKNLVDPNLANDGSTRPILDKIESVTAGDSGDAATFLLYGPPGTGKTTIAESLATLRNWDLVMLSPSEFVVDSLDHIERRSRQIFDHMQNFESTAFLFDEMDTLLRDREQLATSSVGSMIEFVVPALLPKLQAFREHLTEGTGAAFFATNFYERLDAAIIRGGRIDHHILILPYSPISRLKLARQLLERSKTVSVLPQVESFVSDLPCNQTFRDMVTICAAASRGEDTLAELGNRKKQLGISPLIYSPTTRPKAYGELLAFMQRYGGSADTVDPRTVKLSDAKSKFEEYQGLEDFREFFSHWVKALTRLEETM